MLASVFPRTSPISTGTLTRHQSRLKRMAKSKKRAFDARVTAKVPAFAVKPKEPKRLVLKFPIRPLPVSDKPSGFTEPMGQTEHLPFRIVRTASKQLPVYSDIRNHGSRRLTIVKRYIGDTTELVGELQRLLGDEVVVSPKLGRIEIGGHHVMRVKKWMKHLGF